MSVLSEAEKFAAADVAEIRRACITDAARDLYNAGASGEVVREVTRRAAAWFDMQYRLYATHVLSAPPAPIPDVPVACGCCGRPATVVAEVEQAGAFGERERWLTLRCDLLACHQDLPGDVLDTRLITVGEAEAITGEDLTGWTSGAGAAA